MDCISECALHVYLTVISLVPKNTAIYKTFNHLLLGQVTLAPERADGWKSLRKSFNLHNPLHSVVFSPNGEVIATAGVEHGVQVWNVITGKNVASLGDRSTSLLVRFSPSGAFLAGAFEDGTVTVWDPKVGREHLKHEGCHTGPIACLEFSKTGTLLASGSRDHAIQVWSMETGQTLYRLTSHEGPVTSLVFSSDSLWLVSGSEDNLVIIWDMLTGKVICGMMGHRKMVNCVAVSQSGGIVASGSEDGTIKIWDTSSGKCTQTFSKGHHTGIRSVHFYDEDKHVVAGCDDAVLCWNLASSSRNSSDTIWTVGHFFKMALKHFPMWQMHLIGWVPKPVLRLLLNHNVEDTEPRHLTAAYATHSPSYVFIDRGLLFSGTLPLPVDMPLNGTGKTTSVAISSDGNWAATIDPLGSLEIHDLTMPGKTWAEMETIFKSGKIRVADSFVHAPNGTRFIIGNIMAWSLVDADCHVIKRIDVGLMHGMREDGDIRFKFSANSDIFFCVVSGSFSDNKGSIRAFDSVMGEQLAQFKGMKKVHSFVASADGAWIACGHGSGQLDAFRVAGRERLSIKESDGSPINVLLFSDDARELVGGSKTGVVRVWDRASGACKATFEVATSMVTALAYSGTPGGGARVAIGREDGSLCLWSPSTSTSNDILCGDQPTVKSVNHIQFSDDRSKLTSRGEDGTISIWNIAAFDADNLSNPTSLPDLLLSQSDPEDVADTYFRTAYRVRKDGWLVNGDRRVIWFPPTMRPRKDAFHAYENRQVVFWTQTRTLVFLKWDE